MPHHRRTYHHKTYRRPDASLPVDPVNGMSEAQKRVWVCGLICIGLVALVIPRVFWLQYFQHEALARQYNRAHVVFIQRNWPRGSIIDRHGRVMAHDIPAITLRVNTRRLRSDDLAVIGKVVALGTGQPLRDIEQRLNNAFIKQKTAVLAFELMGVRADQMELAYAFMGSEWRHRAAILKQLPDGPLKAMLIQDYTRDRDSSGKPGRPLPLTEDDKRIWWRSVQIVRSGSEKPRLDAPSGEPEPVQRRAFRRVMPNGKLAGNLIGSVNLEGNGIGGLEQQLNSRLKSEPTVQKLEVTRDGVEIPQTERTDIDGRYPEWLGPPIVVAQWLRRAYYLHVYGVTPPAEPAQNAAPEPKRGEDVRLTIDLAIQDIAERALRKMQEQYAPVNSCAIVIAPSTGEILALASMPEVDPNARYSQRDAAAIFDRYRMLSHARLVEPGSIMKPFTIAAALDAHRVTPGAMFNCYDGLMAGPHRIRDSHNRVHGLIALEKVIAFSCNRCTAQIAWKVGRDLLIMYWRRFGFGVRPNDFLYQALSGRLRAGDKNWRLIDTAVAGFGQGISVTALQMAAAYAALANDGVYVRPRILTSEKRETHKAVSPEVARLVRSYLRATVDYGTGALAQTPGYAVGGKTGTAQIASPTGGYLSGAYVVSFAGMAPIHKPRIVVLVMADRPTRNGSTGGQVCGPTFAEIMGKTLTYLGEPADPRLLEKTQRQLTDRD